MGGIAGADIAGILLPDCGAPGVGMVIEHRLPPCLSVLALEVEMAP